MYCTSCGQDLAVTAAFCPSCGARARAAEATAAAPTPSPSSPSPSPTVLSPPPPPPPMSPDATGSRRVLRLRRWGQPTSVQLAADARALALTVAAQLAGCLLLTLVGVVMLPSGHHGSIVDWLRATLALGGFLQRGAVVVEVAASLFSVDGSGNGAYVGPPLLGMVLILTAVLVASRRSERRRPSTGWGQTAARTLGFALAYALVWAVLAFLTRGDVGFGVGTGTLAQVTVGIGSWSACWHTFVAGCLVGGAARISPLLATQPALVARAGTWRSSAVAAVQSLAAACALAVVVAGAWLVHAAATTPSGVSGAVTAPATQLTSGEVRSGASVALVVLAYVLNLVLVGGGGVLGNALGYSASGSSSASAAALPAPSAHVGILLGSGSAWLLLLLVCGWLLTLAVGLRAGTRAAPAQDGAGGLRHLPGYLTASLLLWLVVTGVTSLSFHAHASAAAGSSLGSGTLGGDIEYAGRAGLGCVSTVLVSLLVGLLLFAGHRYVLPVVAAGAPKLTATLAGRRLHPAWALRLADATVRSGKRPQPWLSDLADRAAHLQVRPLVLDRRRLVLGSSLLGGVLALVVVGGLVHQWLSASVYGPEATATAYVRALAQGSASDALAQLQSPPSSASLSDRALAASRKLAPITAVTAGDTIQDGETATAEVSYRQGDQPVQRTFALAQDPHRSNLFGLFPRWVITSGGLAQVALTTDGDPNSLGQITVDGQPVSVADDGTVPVFPGEVDVASTGTTTIAPTTDRVDLRDPASDSGSVSMSAELRPEVGAAVRKAVTQQLAACARSTSLAPDGCPFAVSYPDGDKQLDVRWRLDGSPDVQVSQDTDGQLQVSGEAQLAVSYLEISAFDQSISTDTEQADLTGTATYDGHHATVTLGNVNSSGTD